MVKTATSAGEVATPIGESDAFRAMLAHVSMLAPLNRPVLVVGERGTGKELVARRLAVLSPRGNQPVLKLNCAALPESLLDSELFGHEAGAFTGAQRRRPGRFEQADGGTLFLDEIATASPAVQEKLLRVIEYGSFERLGGGEPLRVDVRVIGATNADLPALARGGRFRADLLDRLAFDVVTVPPLRVRREDIPLLAEHFARRMASELGHKLFAGFAPGALAQLLDHDWPGNVRELRNAVERSLCRAERADRPLTAILLDPFDSPFRPRGAEVEASTRHLAEHAPPLPLPNGEGGFTERTRSFEEALLRDALEQARFNQTKAARSLGLSYHQFRHHLRSHGLLAANRHSPRPEATGADAAAG